jgi:hypothetical protein
MNDWLLTTLPLAVVIYFLVYPAQFALMLNWVDAFIH